MLNATEPKKLYIDIETFALVMESWTSYKAYALKILENTSICAFAAMWEGGKPFGYTLADFKGYKAGQRESKELITKIWELLDEADIVIAHNGDKFDLKQINTIFLRYNLPPPSPYKSVDTLKEAKKIGKFDSNKLKDLGIYFGLGTKLETGGYTLWDQCKAGIKSAWKTMKAYNIQDVVLLRLVYLKLLPYMKAHPNVGMFHDKIVCPRCGSGKIQSRGEAVTKTCRYKRYQCQGCGSWGRSTMNTQELKPIVSI